jgi:MoxR-like ATPase
MEKEAFNSAKKLIKAMEDQGYICDEELALTIYLSYHLGKPLLLEGPAGVGKTEIANVISKILNNNDPIRLQCFEGIDKYEAIYDFDYRKQLLYIEASKEDNNWDEMKSDIYSEDFLSPRPLLKSIRSKNKSVLLIDEIDKSDEEFESFLLEILSEFQVSIPEIGTVKAKTTPFVVLTSNNMRELSDALKRRCCYFHINYPSLEKELSIIHKKINNVDDLLATQIVKFVELIRNEDINKRPSISETIDWVKALTKLGADTLDKSLVKYTMNTLLKSKEDLEIIEDKIDRFLIKLPNKPIKLSEDVNIDLNNIDNNIEDELNNNDNWNY